MRMQRLPTSPFSSRLLDISTVIICLLVLWLPSAVDVGSMQSLHRFLNERSFAQQMTVYVIIRNLLAAGIALKQKKLPDCYARQLRAFSIFPILLGITGAIRVTTLAFVGLADYLARSPSPTTEGAFSGLLAVMSLSMDNLVLGLIGTIIGVGLYYQAMSTKRS